MDRVHSTINTSGPIQRRIVSAAHWLRPSPKLDVAKVVLIEDITPGCAPAVLDQPIVSFIGIGAISDQEDSVVDNNILVIVAAIKHSAPIKTPVRGSHGSRQRT